MLKFGKGHIWFMAKDFDFAINYPPFYRRPYAMVSVTIKDARFALWFGKYWLPHLVLLINRAPTAKEETEFVVRCDDGGKA